MKVLKIIQLCTRASNPDYYTHVCLKMEELRPSNVSTTGRFGFFGVFLRGDAKWQLSLKSNFEPP